MAKIIWTEPALQDLDAIADYIALDNPEAARRLVQRVFRHIEQLENFQELLSRKGALSSFDLRKTALRQPQAAGKLGLSPMPILP